MTRNFPPTALVLAAILAPGPAFAARAAHDEDPHHHHHHGPVIQPKDFDHAVRLIRDGLESIDVAVARGDLHALHTLSDGVAVPARALGKLAAARPGSAPGNLRAIQSLGQDLATLVDAMHHAADAGKSEVVVAKWEQIKPLRIQLDEVAPRARLMIQATARPDSENAQATITTLTASIRDAQGRTVSRFEPVHGAALHLFLVGPELAEFTHTASDSPTDGVFGLDLAVGLQGGYTAFALARPAGSTSPSLLRENVTVTEESRATPPPLRADTEPSVLVGGYLVRATLPDHIHAGEEGEFLFRIDEQAAPGGIRFEPLWSAPAFVTAVSADRRRLVAAPTIESPSEGTVLARLTLETPGLHAVFLEFRHRGAVHTARFVIDVHAADCAHDH